MSATPQSVQAQWTPAELDVLRSQYEEGGYKAVAPHLPGRTRCAILTRAGHLKLRNKHRDYGGRRYILTSPAIDAAIVKLYGGPIGRGQVTAAAKRLERPVWWITKRAVALGVVKATKRDPQWTEAETELLAETAHFVPAVAARVFHKKGFPRSAAAIVTRRKIVHALPSDCGYYNASQVASFLGVAASTVGLWCQKQWLRAERRGTDRTAAQGGDQWWMDARSLRRFVVEQPMLIDHRKIPASSWPWFVEIVSGGAA
jgi:hypothetical protein